LEPFESPFERERKMDYDPPLPPLPPLPSCTPGADSGGERE